MIKIFKDIKILYFTFLIIYAIAVAAVLEGIAINTAAKSVVSFLAIFLVLVIVAVFNRFAKKRFFKILSPANDRCETEKSLNYLYGIYKGRTNKKSDLFLAIYISNVLCHSGKYDAAIKMLLSYNAEALLKRNNEITLKYFYYSQLIACYTQINKKEDALNLLNKAEQALDSPYFNKKLKPLLEQRQKISRMLLEDTEENAPEVISALKEMISQEEMLLSKVSLSYTIVTVLKKCDKMDEAGEYIDFIKENGGDTVYAKCAHKNDFSYEFLNSMNKEKFVPSPAKFKDFKPVIISLAMSLVIIVSLLLWGFTNVKTIYVNDYNNSGTYDIQTYDKNGNIISWEMECHTTYDSEEVAELQYGFCDNYLHYKDYEGCEVFLVRSGKRIDFELKVDFSKTTDNLESFMDYKPTEKEYVAVHELMEFKISKYKKFLFVTWLDGTIEPKE